MHNNAGSPRGIRRSEGKSAPRRRGLFIETPFLAPCQRRTATTDDEPSFHEPTKAHLAVTPTRQCSRRGSAPENPKTTKTRSVGGRTDQPRKDDTGRAMARPVDQLPQEGKQTRGGPVWPPKMRLHDRQRGVERLVGFTTNYNTPHHTTWQHHVCSAMQCNAIPQSPDDWPCRYMRPTTARCAHTPRVDQQAGTSGPTPIGRTGAAR